MKIVVDTNVFVSAAFKELSWPGMVVRWVDKFGGLLKTPATEQEVLDVLRRPRIAENTVPLFAARLRRIFAAAELVTITERIAACRDPKDDKFLELARRSDRLRRCRLAGARYFPGNPGRHPGGVRSRTGHVICVLCPRRRTAIRVSSIRNPPPACRRPKDRFGQSRALVRVAAPSVRSLYTIIGGEPKPLRGLAGYLAGC